jgi:hypothetical protein
MKIMNELRDYQQEVFRAAMESVYHRRGLTFTVEMARQGGKNEVSARIQQCLLSASFNKAKNIVKCSPTFHPQAKVSIDRLKDKLDDAGYRKLWTGEQDYIVKLGSARAIFLSAEE